MSQQESSTSQDLIDLIHQYGESYQSYQIFTYTASRFYYKLMIIKIFLMKELLRYSNQDFIQFTKLLQNFINFTSNELYSSGIDLSSPEKYQEIKNNYDEMNRLLIQMMSSVALTPFFLLHCPWTDLTNFYLDWRKCLSEVSNSSPYYAKLASYRPERPKLRCMDPERITLLNQIQSSTDFDDDDDDSDALHDCVKGYFAVVAKSPVHLKLFSPDACVSSNNIGVLELAYTVASIPRSDFLHRVLAVCKECTHFRAYQSGDMLQPFPKSGVIGLLSSLAPFGSLKIFLSRPPDECLIDEVTYEPLPRSKGGVLAPDIKLSILLDISNGLSFLHSRGYLHGRLHHNNVLIFQGFRAKLTDFGISSLLSTPAKKYAVKNDEVEITTTHTGGIRYSKIGNDPRWQAPEIVLRDINLLKTKETSSISPRSLATIAVSFQPLCLFINNRAIYIASGC